MSDLPTPEAIREKIAALDVIQKKVLGGLIVLMIQNHTQVKDREWIYEALARISVPALGLEEEGEVDADLAKVQEFVQTSSGPVLDVAFPLFAKVAEDMQVRMARGASYSLEDACLRAMEYFE